jgi:amino acid adenylation domain-containing protein
VTGADDLARRLETLSPKQRKLIELRLARERQEKKPAAGEEAIQPQPRDGRPFPLSFAQQRLWFLDQLEPGSPWYNMAFPLRLTGRLDAPALAAALSEIRRRHETLRTTFSLAGDGEEEAVQVVGPPSGLPLPLVDLRGLPPAVRETELQHRVRTEARRPFDLARGPLLRAFLYAADEDEHALILTMHHIVCDGWSLGVLVRELGEALFRRTLPPLPIQYADFAVWQRRLLSGPALDKLLSYWKRQLAGLPPLLELPTDRPRPRVQTFRGSILPVALPPGTTAAVRELSRRSGATPFMTLLATFLTLLRRHTRQDDLTVGTPVANRGRMEIEGLIGFFVNTLVLRTDVSGDPSFRELLARVQASSSGAYAHQDLPFEMLVQEIDPERQLSHNPLFQVMFLLQNAPMPELSVSGLKLAPLATGGGTSKFDLSLHFWEAEPELIGYFEYNTDLFDRATVARLADHFVRLLQGVVADPDSRLSALPLLSPAERRQVLVEWNDSAADYPRAACLHDLFTAQAERTPDAVALMDWQGRERVTYEELAGRAGHLARRLRDMGVGPDVPVAVCLRRSPAMTVAVLAALGAGGCYVPVDPSYPRERLEMMLEIARPRVLLTQEALRDAIPPGDFEVICLDAEEGTGPSPQVAVSPDNLAYVIFTSGSTGVPKGVAMPHRPLVNLVAWQLQNSVLGPGAKTLQFASLSFDVSCQELFSTWAAGGTLVLISEELRLDPGALLDALCNQAVERLFLPFVALQQLAEIAAERAAEGASEGNPWPEVLREVVTAGEQLQITPAVAELFTRLPECRLFNQYGPSETHVATAYALPGPARTWPALPSVGVPVANTRVLLLDGGLVPAGVAGELCIGGDCLARGYLSRPDLTADRFVPDPFADGERLYRTGDLARWHRDGNLEFLGRTDQQLKIRGFRVEPGEIEAVLAAHPAVREAAVVARQDPGVDLKIGARRLVAYVATQGTVTAGELRAAMRERLPDYMVPSAFHFLEALPLTPSGKIDRRGLPDLEAAGEEAGAVPPRTPLEEEIAGIWRQVMGVERVGVHDNFFDLGGHSLLAVRLLARIRRQLGRDLPLASLFAGPTIAHQAAVLEHEPVSDTPLVALRSTGTQRPLFLVHPVGGSVFCYTELTRALGPDQPVYGLQSLETDGTLEEMAAAYLEALRAVQPNGPYRLGGWSMGGVVAFEMARQLGGQVEQLAVLDVPAPGRGEAVDEGTLRAWFARDLAGLQGKPLPEELGALSAGTPLSEAFARVQELGLLPGLDFTAAARRFEIFRANLRRIERYAAHPYPGRIHLFRAEASHFDDPADPTLGWGALAAGGVELRRLPGSHWAIVSPPAVEAVAAALRLS